MKILFMNGSLDNGGAERVTVNLCNQFCIENDVKLVLTKLGDNCYKLNKEVKIKTLENKKENKFFRNFNLLKRLYEEIVSFQPDVIIAFLNEPIARILILKTFFKKIKKIPVIISIRNDPNLLYKSLKNRMIVKLLYHKVNGCVFQTPEQKKYFNDSFQKKSVIIANPINKNFLVDQELSEKEKIFVTVGRLTNQKNQKLLIDAFSNISSKYPDFKLYIYGKGSLKEELMQLAEEKNLLKNNKIVFKGTTPNLPSELKNKYAFILTSDFEGMPNALMEAMALGLPCISTDCGGGGAKFLIKHNENGVIVPIKDKDALVDAMEKLILEPDFARQLGNNAEKIKTLYTEEKITDVWMNYIKKICE